MLPVRQYPSRCEERRWNCWIPSVVIDTNSNIRTARRSDVLKLVVCYPCDNLTKPNLSFRPGSMLAGLTGTATLPPLCALLSLNWKVTHPNHCTCLPLPYDYSAKSCSLRV